MAGAACTAVRAAEVGSALQRERGRAVVGAADAMRVPLRRAAAPQTPKVSAPVRYVGCSGWYHLECWRRKHVCTYTED